MPGLAECILKKNHLVYVNIQGHQEAETRNLVTDRSLFRCFSMTKPITAFGMMALWERGAFGLDDPVAKYIPAFKHVKVLKNFDADGPGPRGGGLEDPRRPITLRHLVTHTSGLGYGPARVDGKDKLVAKGPRQRTYFDLVKRTDAGEIPDLQSFCDELAKSPLCFHPGDRYKYSFGMDVIGRVLEVVSGLPLDRLLRNLVLAPIGMNDSRFFLSEEQAKKRLMGFYSVKAVSKHRVSKKPNKFRALRRDGRRAEKSAWVKGRTARIFAGGGAMGSYWGGLVSSLRDQALFCSVIANRGYAHSTGQQVLQPATVRAMCKDWLRLKSVTRKHYLKGWHDECKKMGWGPMGFVSGNDVFMGGVGFWSINLPTKTIAVTMLSTWGDDAIHGWDEKIDELEGCMKKSASVFKNGCKGVKSVRKRKLKAIDNLKGPSKAAKKA